MAVMLHKDPHPVHREMAEAIDASLVPAEDGGLVARLRSAVTSTYNEPVVLEGGMPLVEGAFLKWLRRADTVILLAGDETLHDVDEGLDHYTALERSAHAVALEAVDGVIALSRADAKRAKTYCRCPIETAEPFAVEPLASDLMMVPTDVSGEKVLCVGESRPSMGHDVFVEACEAAGAEPVLVGEGTEEHGGEGWVDHEALVKHYREASLFCLPASAGAHPVVAIEAMLAGVPPITSALTGAAPLAASVDERLVCLPEVGPTTNAIERMLAEDDKSLREVSERARLKAGPYRPGPGRRRFRVAYEEVLDRI